MPADSFDQVYDIETAIESGFKAVFAEDGLTAYTINDLGETQKERPRVEIMYQHGGEAGHNSTASTYYRPDTFTGSLTVAVVTNSKDESIGIAEHAQFRGRVRNIMVKSRTRFKADRDAADVDALLPHHCVLDVVESGTSPGYSPDDGHLVSRINYELKVCIRDDAWPSE
jgi:hypothetical protein